jgi:hypothetical protein
MEMFEQEISYIFKFGSKCSMTITICRVQSFLSPFEPENAVPRLENAKNERKSRTTSLYGRIR